MAGIMFGTQKGAVGFLPSKEATEVKDIYIDLPADFDGASSIYYFAVSGSRILFSSNITDIGVWEYNVETRTSTQIYNAGENWQNFQMVGENCLISSNVATGILFFNSYDNQISLIYESGSGWNEFLQVGDNYLIAGRNATGVLFYNHLFNTIEVKYALGNWSILTKVRDNVLIGSNSSIGILVYDVRRKESFESIKDYWYEQLKVSGEENMVFGVAGNKCDLFQEEQVSEEEGKKFAKSIGAVFHLTSCKESIGIDELFEECGKKYLEDNQMINENNKVDDDRKIVLDKKNINKGTDSK